MADGVSTKDFDWSALCKEVEGEKLREKPVAYEFSNGRQFKSPEEFGGVYQQES